MKKLFLPSSPLPHQSFCANKERRVTQSSEPIGYKYSKRCVLPLKCHSIIFLAKAIALYLRQFKLKGLNR